VLEINQIHHGDCLELMKEIPDNSIDCIITDPPYNISQKDFNVDRSKCKSKSMRRKSKLVYDFGEWDNKSRKDFLEFTYSWIKECCRVLKDGGTIISFFDNKEISYLGWVSKEFGIKTRAIFSWCKSNPVPSFKKVNYLSSIELIWIGSKGEKTWTFNFKQQKEMKNFMITANKSAYGETKHPTEKPKELINHLLQIHTNVGDLVLDIFSGSGTTAVCCKELGRIFIGIEKEREYFEMAQKRLSQNTLMEVKQ